MEDVKIKLKGRIDSNNAPEVERDIFSQLEGYDGAPVVMDAGDLVYISSAGLRVILRVKKTHPDMEIVGVSQDVYDIFDMTGFTEMLTVKKAYRVVSVEGCEEIGRGANGSIYRIDQDNVVKVYNNADALADIQHERWPALRLFSEYPQPYPTTLLRSGTPTGRSLSCLMPDPFPKYLRQNRISLTGA